MPQVSSVAPPESILNLEEGRAYQPPNRSYPNNALDGLEEAVDAFFDGTGPLSDVEAWMDELEVRLARLQATIPKTLEAIERQKELDPDDLPHQIAYLIQVGGQLFNEGMDGLNQILDGSDESIDDVLVKLRKGNDYICHSSGLVDEIFARVGQPIPVEEVN